MKYTGILKKKKNNEKSENLTILRAKGILSNLHF